jgi:hypothetical protein
MSDTLLVSTRKGLFTVARKAKQWEITAIEFLGLWSPGDDQRRSAVLITFGNHRSDF